MDESLTISRNDLDLCVYLSFSLQCKRHRQAQFAVGFCDLAGGYNHARHLEYVP